MASTINIPFDVAKSRIQGHLPENGPRKYHTCIQSILLIKREEGARALYKGLVPKILRLGPGIIFFLFLCFKLVVLLFFLVRIFKKISKVVQS